MNLEEAERMVAQMPRGATADQVCEALRIMKGWNVWPIPLVPISHSYGVPCATAPRFPSLADMQRAEMGDLDPLVSKATGL